MKKTIYFGQEKGFWWHTRFKEFMENLDFIEILIENNFTPMSEALKLPLLYYSNKHNVTLLYQREQTVLPESYHREGGSPGLIRAKINLFGDEKDIENLEWLIKGEAKKYRSFDNLKH